MIRPMIRKSALGLAAAATLAAAMATTASTASAGASVSFSFGFPAYGYHAPYGYIAPQVSYYHCPRILVGYRTVRTRHGWQQRPMYRRQCGY